MALAAMTSFPFALLAAPPGVAPPTGLRQNTPSVHALTNARIVTAPGKLIERGTVVVRDGLIESVGGEVKLPPEARIWDLDGKTVYAGFVDAYSELSSTAKPPVSAAGYWNSKVTPQVRADELLAADAELNKKLRGQGIAVRLVAPTSGIIKARALS
jgi:imidazolonepropionase-like amidohydrolase